MVHSFLALSAEVIMALLFPVLIWAVIAYFLVSLVKTLRDGVEHLQQLHRIPCDRCQYYTGSYYLKCPVHPLTAFSQDAIECQDFESVNNSQPHTGCSRPKDKDQLAYRQ